MCSPQVHRHSHFYIHLAAFFIFKSTAVHGQVVYSSIHHAQDCQNSLPKNQSANNIELSNCIDISRKPGVLLQLV